MVAEVAPCQQQTRARRQNRQNGHHAQRLQRAPANAVVLTCAQILRREAGHGAAQRVHGRGHQIEQPVGRAKAVLRRVGHHHAVPHVELHHAALHDDDADGQHGELQAKGNAAGQVPFHIHHGDAPVLPVQAQHRIAHKGVDKAADGADQLRQHRGKGCARHAPAEHQNERQIQPHVQHRGEQQEQQRCHGIAHGAQEGADEVVKQLRADTGEDDGAVGVRRGVHLVVGGRHVDPRQHGIQQHQRQGRQCHRQRRRQKDLRGQRAPHPALVVHTHIVRGDDAEACADAEGELQKDEHQRIGIVDAGHLGGGQRLTNDGRVADGVHLLQKVGQDHRQRKQEDHLPARPLGQVDGLPSFMCCFHRNRSLLLCSIDNYLSQSADYNTLRRHCQELFYKKSVHRSFPVPRCRSSRILRRISAFRQWTQPVFRCTFCHFVVRYH